MMKKWMEFQSLMFYSSWFIRALVYKNVFVSSIWLDPILSIPFTDTYTYLFMSVDCFPRIVLQDLLQQILLNPFINLSIPSNQFHAMHAYHHNNPWIDASAIAIAQYVFSKMQTFFMEWIFSVQTSWYQWISFGTSGSIFSVPLRGS